MSGARDDFGLRQPESVLLRFRRSAAEEPHRIMRPRSVRLAPLACHVEPWKTMMSPLRIFQLDAVVVLPDRVGGATPLVAPGTIQVAPFSGVKSSTS